METVQTTDEKELPADKNEVKDKVYLHQSLSITLQLELELYQLQLEFVDELQLSKEPLRIDVVIIKKESGTKIKKNIGHIFEDYNIFEFKSTNDSLSIWSYIKVIGYAVIYSAFKKVPLDDITVSFVCNPHPRELFKYLKNERGFSIEEVMQGIYYVDGDIFKVQIIELKKLSDQENLFLKTFRSDLTFHEVKTLVDKSDKYKGNELFATYMARIMKANQEVSKEVMNVITCPETYDFFDEICNMTGVKERYQEETKAETALNMLQDGLPVDKVAGYVEMTVAWVKKLIK